MNILATINLIGRNSIRHPSNFLTKSDSLLFNNIANIVDAILSIVTGLQLLHFDLSPVLYIEHIIPLFLCIGSCFYRIFLKLIYIDSVSKFFLHF
jgi:hypothetical protein